MIGTPHFDAANGVVSKGRRKLLELLQYMSQCQVAASVRCSRSCIAKLASGRRRLNDLDLAVRFRKRWAIPVDDWLIDE